MTPLSSGCHLNSECDIKSFVLKIEWRGLTSPLLSTQSISCYIWNLNTEVCISLCKTPEHFSAVTVSQWPQSHEVLKQCKYAQRHQYAKLSVHLCFFDKSVVINWFNPSMVTLNVSLKNADRRYKRDTCQTSRSIMYRSQVFFPFWNFPCTKKKDLWCQHNLA